MVLLGVPEKPATLPALAIIPNRRSIVGSLIGGIKETQEMLDFSAANSITADVETIPVQDIDVAYQRMLKRTCATASSWTHRAFSGPDSSQGIPLGPGDEVPTLSPGLRSLSPGRGAKCVESRLARGLRMDTPSSGAWCAAVLKPGRCTHEKPHRRRCFRRVCRSFRSGAGSVED
jgi:hypothetical protein